MSLHGTYDDANLFAKILRGELPAVKVCEDEATLAFMDLFPQARGHTLIVPKSVAARNFLDLPEHLVGPVLSTTQKVARAIDKALKPDGIVLTQFNGAPAGQSVFHVHFHLIPRYEGVALAGHSHANRADIADLEAIAREIAAKL